jgi:hypothetical protein
MIVSAAAVIAVIFVTARAIYYPFWAFSADRGELERSWGGPSPVGAIAAHWLVAVIAAAVAGLVGRWAWRARRRSPS